MLQKIFAQEGFLWKGLNTLTDLIFLSVIWAFLCLPVITIGPATTALYYTAVHCIRRKEYGPYQRFFRTFRAALGRDHPGLRADCPVPSGAG